MYAPLGALSAFAKGGLEGYTEDSPKIFDMMGMQALGKAFMQGPLDRGPQPPMPGQPSMPAPSMAQGPMPNGQPPLGSPAPMMPQGGGAPPPSGSPPMAAGMPPPGSPPGGGPMQGGMPGAPSQGGLPQFDLHALAARIRAANPDLPPQAMFAALNRAAPLLSMQGKIEMAQLRQSMQQQMLEYRRDALDTRERLGTRNYDLQERRLDRQDTIDQEGPKGSLTPAAVNNAAERYLKTGTMPPNIGRGVQGRADLAAIQNKAAELANERGIDASQISKDQQKFKAEGLAIGRFMSGPQGNTIRSLNVVVDHLATMRDLTTALQNGNMQVFNRIAQGFAEQTGGSAPTNLDTAKQIVGAEIIKALGVAGAGTQAERAEAANAFSRARSPEQLMGAIKVAQQLLTGQLGGLRQQFVKATGLKQQDFDDLLLPEAKGFLQRTPEKAANPKVPASNGWSIQRID